MYKGFQNYASNLQSFFKQIERIDERAKEIDGSNEKAGDSSPAKQHNYKHTPTI